MSRSQVVIPGTVREDGTLELHTAVPLPPGDVDVTVQTKTSPTESGASVWKTLERIWADQQARGHVPLTHAEIDAELQTLRDEWSRETASGG